MKELLTVKCRLKHIGDGIYICAKIMHCPKIGKYNGVFGADCLKVIL